MTTKPTAALNPADGTVHLHLPNEPVSDEVLSEALVRALEALPGATRVERLEGAEGWRIQLKPEAGLPGIQRWVDHLMRERTGPFDN